MTWLTARMLRDPEPPFVSDMPSVPLPDGVRRFTALSGGHLERFGEPSRSAEAARAAYRNGRDEGFRSGYISGMHWGLLSGAIAGALLVCLLLWAQRAIWPHVLLWLGL